MPITDETVTGETDRFRPSAPAGLAMFAVAYGIAHHGGTFFSGLGRLPAGGALGTTRWADWIDVITPVVVLAPLAWALAAGRPTRSQVALGLAFAVVYVEGHGIHLAANSIGNVAAGPTAHLWDEVIGHYLMASGLAGLLAVVALRLGGGSSLTPRWLAVALSLVVGGTWATNALEGGTAILGLVAAAAFCWWGWRLRGRAGEVLLWAFGPALAIVVAYGISHGGFPQPSSLDGAGP